MAKASGSSQHRQGAGREQDHGDVQLIPHQADVWRNLPSDLQDVVISYLPAQNFWATVMAVNPRRWREIQSSPAFSPQRLGHGENLASSYGFLMSCEENCPQKGGALTVYSFEHENGKWDTIASLDPDPSLGPRVQVLGGSGGLVFVTEQESVSSKLQGLIIWNPLRRSSRRLSVPTCPTSEDVYYVVHLDAVKRLYKVMKLEYWAAVGPGYSIYDSVSRDWSEVKLLGYIRRNSRLQINSPWIEVSCDEYICFAGGHDDTLCQSGIILYNSRTDLWQELILDAQFLASKTLVGASIYSLVAVSGTIYMIMTVLVGGMLRKRDGPTHIISLNMRNITAGASFQHVTEVLAYDDELDSESDKYLTSYPHYCEFWYTIVTKGRSFICRIVTGRTRLQYDVSANTWTRKEQPWPQGHSHLDAWRLCSFEPSLHISA